MTTAKDSGIERAAAKTADPPRLCPMSNSGGSSFSRKNCAAASRSSRLQPVSKIPQHDFHAAQPHHTEEILDVVFPACG